MKSCKFTWIQALQSRLSNTATLARGGNVPGSDLSQNDHETLGHPGRQFSSPCRHSPKWSVPPQLTSSLLKYLNMIIIDEKSQPMDSAPPPYEDLPLLPFHISPRPPPTLDTLSPHLLLQIVNSLFPQTSNVSKGKVERRRETLYYLSTSLRLVNRVFYVGQ